MMSTRLILTSALLLACSDAFTIRIQPQATITSFPSALYDGVSGAQEQQSENTVHVALTTREEDDVSNSVLRSALEDHPFRTMTGMELSIVDIPCVSSDSSENITWTDSEESIVDRVDIAEVACFVSPVAVASWLDNIDEELNVPDDISDDDRRQLPNGDVLAACACSETARACLDSGRWISNNIYYPKGSDRNIGGDDSVEEWAALIMQASGDVMERKFWGGGW